MKESDTITEIKHSYFRLLAPLIFAFITFGFYPFLAPILSSQQRALLLIGIIFGILIMTIPILLGLLLVRIRLDSNQLTYKGYYRHKIMNISDINSITFRQINSQLSTITVNFQDDTTPSYAIWSFGFDKKQMKKLFEAIKVCNSNVSTQILGGNSKISKYYDLSK